MGFIVRYYSNINTITVIIREVRGSRTIYYSVIFFGVSSFFFLNLI